MYKKADLSISIVDNFKIKSLFVKANDHILTKYSNLFENLQDDFKIKMLSDCWKKEFNAGLNIGDQIIEFDRKKDMTMFLLKWS